MDASDRSRLEKLLGMLGSSFDGERATAARMISDMAVRQKLTIVELIYGPQQSTRQSSAQEQRRKQWQEENQRREREQQQQREQQQRQQQQRQQHADKILKALSEIAKNSDAYEFVLTNWECQFASDVSQRYTHDYELSAKQLNVAQRIVAKVDAARERR
jgi:hypothetical protein